MVVTTWTEFFCCQYSILFAFIEWGAGPGGKRFFCSSTWACVVTSDGDTSLWCYSYAFIFRTDRDIQHLLLSIVGGSNVSYVLWIWWWYQMLICCCYRSYSCWSGVTGVSVLICLDIRSLHSDLIDCKAKRRANRKYSGKYPGHWLVITMMEILPSSDPLPSRLEFHF